MVKSALQAGSCCRFLLSLPCARGLQFSIKMSFIAFALRCRLSRRQGGAGVAVKDSSFRPSINQRYLGRSLIVLCPAEELS